MSVLLKVSQQTAWQLVSKLITSLATLLILAIISQSYGESGTGVYTLALTYLAFFYIAVDLGLNAHLLPKLVNGEKTVWQKLLGSRIILSAGLIILSLLILPFVSFGNPDYSLSILIGTLTILSQAIFLTLQALYQATHRYDLISKAMIVSTPVTVGIIYLMAQNNTPLPYLFLAHLAGWLVFILVSLGLISGKSQKLTPLFDLNFLTDSLKAVWPIALTLFLNTIYFRVDVFLISYFHSFSEVGIYNFAYQFFQTALVVPTFIMNSYYPILIQGTGIRVQGLVKAALVLAGLGLLGTVVTWLLSPLLLPLISGNGFIGSVESLKILSLSFPGFFVSALLMWVLISFKKYKTILVIYTVGLLINIILNLVFIPVYSYIASSWITGLTEYLILGMQVFILCKLART